MTRRRRRALIAAGVALVLVAAGGLVAFAPWEEDEGTGAGEFPTALGKHIEKLIESIPGREGFAEGPSSGYDAAYLARAYPSNTITVAQSQSATQAALTADLRDFPAGKGHKGTWVSIGPDTALYPATPLRNAFSYIPAEYVAGDRKSVV